MATSRALLILDIVQLIIDEIAVAASDQYKQDLFHLAQVCRRFRDPAIRALWAKMTTLDPLFRLLSNREALDPLITEWRPYAPPSDYGKMWGSGRLIDRGFPQNTRWVSVIHDLAPTTLQCSGPQESTFHTDGTDISLCRRPCAVNS